MTQKRTTKFNNIIKQVRSREFVIILFIIAVSCAACQQVAVNTNQTTPSPSATQGKGSPSPRPTAGSTQFASWEEALKGAKEYAGCGTKVTGTHDDQIIVTDGSVHIEATKSSIPTTPPGNDYYEMNADGTVLTSKQKAYLEFVVIDDGGTLHSAAFATDQHGKATLEYRAWDQFLTLTTLGTKDKLVLASPNVPFSSADWIRSDADHKLVYEGGTAGYHTSVTLATDIILNAPDHKWPVPGGNSKILYYLCVEDATPR